MRRLAAACACTLCSLEVGCTRPNELFFLAADGPASGASTDMSSETSADTAADTEGGLVCPDFDPRSDPVALCELAAADPPDLGELPPLAEACDGPPVTLGVRRRAAAPDLLELCDDACAACPTGHALDPAAPRHAFLLDPAILPTDACARLTHAGTRAADATCTTARLALWIGDEPVPRFAAGVDALVPIAGTGLDLRRDDPYTCGCADADKQASDRYPCCATSTVRYFDLLVTPDGSCPLRVRRGPAEAQPIEIFGEPRLFTLHNAYEYADPCAEAHQTLVWTLTPG